MYTRCTFQIYFVGLHKVWLSEIINKAGDIYLYIFWHIKASIRFLSWSLMCLIMSHEGEVFVYEWSWPLSKSILRLETPDISLTFKLCVFNFSNDRTRDDITGSLFGVNLNCNPESDVEASLFLLFLTCWVGVFLSSLFIIGLLTEIFYGMS